MQRSLLLVPRLYGPAENAVPTLTAVLKFLGLREPEESLRGQAHLNDKAQNITTPRGDPHGIADY